MKRLAVFDLDGTLNQTHLYSIKAQREALREFGADPVRYPDEALLGCLGKPGSDYAHELLPEASADEIRRFLQLEMDWEQRLIGENCACFEGIIPALTQLRQSGYRTAVCSNSSADYIGMVLRALNIEALLDTRQQLLPGLTKADTLRLLLSRETPDRAVMIGDRIYDMQAAHQNGIPFIGCRYGYAPHEMAGADIAVETASALYDAVQALIG
jgi:phosphoglycolate phosphatase